MTKELFLQNNYKTFFGELYGRNKQELNTEFIEIKKSSCEIVDDGIYCVWGWPGPDYNFYKWTDYGETWAFTKQELPGCKFYEERKEILSEVAFDAKGNILYIKQIKEYPYSMHPIIHKDNSITVKYIPSFDKEKVLEMAYKEREKSLKFLKSVGRI